MNAKDLRNTFNSKMDKEDYVICSKPDYISFDCPHCNDEMHIDWEKIYPKLGSDLYYGEPGTVDCPKCGQEIELGSPEYD